MDDHPQHRWPEIHFHFHEAPNGDVLARLDEFNARLDANTAGLDANTDSITALRIGTFALAQSVNTLEDTVATDLTALTNEVSENGDAVDSAVTLLSSLSQQIRDLSTDPAALQALADSLDANTARLAQAVVDNTPSATPPADTGDGGTPTP